MSGAPLMPVDDHLLRALLNSIPARVVVIDRGHRYLFANTESLSFFGRTEEQMVGVHASEVVGPGYAAYGAMHERIFVRGEVIREEGWVEYAALGRRYVQHLVLPYVPPGDSGAADAGQAVKAAFVFARDLTELKQREADLADRLEELATSQALKSSIVDHALAAIITTDDAGHIVEFNPAAEAMFGHAREQAMGRLVGDLIVPPRLRPAHAAGMAALAAGGAPRIMGQRVERQALRADGSEFAVEVLLWRTEVNGRGHVTASMFDLTERHVAQRQIERQRDALRQSEKLTAMGSLLAGVAHELNNPLAIVLGRAALLQEKAAAWPELLSDARRIHEAAERCGRIVRTFLNMARSRPLQRAPVQLNDLVRAAADILAYSLRSHGVTLSLALAPQLPPVIADADQLGQVVLNLLVNAQQALAAVPHERRVVTLSTGVHGTQVAGPAAPAETTAATAATTATVWLRVADLGPGVPADIRDRLFDPFFTTKSEGAGTGLGLSVSRSIARDHGGELALESPAQGACFCLSLPLGEAAVAEDSAAMPLAPLVPARARILVVDDEPDIVDLLRELLQAAGHEVLVATSGAAALRVLEGSMPDAIISDLHMPELDGAALWREVKQRHPVLARRMLFVTGDTLSPAARSFLDESRCPGLNKPFTKAELMAQVVALLDGSARTG